MEMRPGSVVNERYQLETLLGEGAFGSVWRATQLGIGRRVAVKFLKHTSLSGDSGRRFKMEAAALGRLSHPNCLTLFDFGESESGAPFIVTEFLDGETLDVWSMGSRTLGEKVEVARQIAAALGHAHRHNIVHRDLKPANILICQDDDGGILTKVLDFGVAKALGEPWPDITKTGLVVGTPGYMSPEQLTGQELTRSTDLYSLGVVMFEMLTGFPPFDGDTGLALALRHVKEPAPLLDESFPPNLRGIVASLLAKNPRDRPPDARAVVAALDPSAAVQRFAPASEPHPAPAAPVREPRTKTAVRSGRRVSGASIVLGLLVIAASVGVGGAVLRLYDEPAPVPGNRIAAALNSGKNARSAPATDPVDTGVAEVGNSAPDVGVADAGSDAAVAAGNRSVGCGGDAVRGGGRVVSSVTGDLRSERVFTYVPSRYDPRTPHPVLIMFHDTAQSPQQLLSMTGFQEFADEQRVVLVMPADNPVSRTWKRTVATDRAIRELQMVGESLCLDMDRVSTFGHGSGGMAAELLRCKYPRLRAMAIGGYRMRPADNFCPEAAPTPQLFLAPLKGLDPVETGPDCFGGTKISLAAHEKIIRDRNACKAERTTEAEHKTSVCYTWDCEQPFVSCHIDGGRPWPGHSSRVDCEGAAAKFPYREKIWRFLKPYL